MLGEIIELKFEGNFSNKVKNVVIIDGEMDDEKIMK
jgi:hypothetical protein